MITEMILAIELALLFVHEMDAVYRQEWKMFIILKDMEGHKARSIFTLLHIPLYAGLMLLLFSPHAGIGYYIVDIFLAAHAVLHIGFTKHQANQLNGLMSRMIIYSAGILAVIHFIAVSCR